MKDKNGIEIKVGDILRYQETPDNSEDYGKSIDEVVEIDGNLCGVQRVGFPRWTQLDGMNPVPLSYYASYLSDEVGCAEIIGNVIDNPERMTPEYAYQIFPSDKANMKFGDLEKTDSGQPHVAEYRLAVNRLNRTIKPYAARGIKV